MWQLRTAAGPSLPATALIGFRPRRRVKLTPSGATEGERGWEGTLSGERVERRLTALLAADVRRLFAADGRRRRRRACGAEAIRRATGLSTRYVIMIRKGLGIQPQETISILVAKRSKASIGLN
jgi:hypothetical protein